MWANVTQSLASLCFSGFLGLKHVASIVFLQHVAGRFCSVRHSSSSFITESGQSTTACRVTISLVCTCMLMGIFQSSSGWCVLR